MDKGVILGHVPATEASGLNFENRTQALLPWHKAGRVDPGDGARWNKNVITRVPVPEAMVQQMQAGLPVVVRRTSRQRYKVLVDRLVQDGLKSYRTYGYPVWPKSIQDELRVLGWKEGDPRLREQVEALAAKLILEVENKQRESDSRQVTRGWHGHYD